MTTTRPDERKIVFVARSVAENVLAGTYADYADYADYAELVQS